MSDNLPNRFTKTQETLITLIWDEPGRNMLKRMFEQNPFIHDLLLSEGPSTVSEEFAMLTYAAAESEEERTLHEILATKDGIEAMRRLLEINKPLANELDFISLKHVPDENNQNSPWI